MARSQAEKARTRARMIKAARNAFGRHGVGGVSIANLMSAIGMTHGGFYNHFASKEELVEKVLSEAIEQAEQQKSQRDQASGGNIGAYLDWYLSAAHRDQVQTGCPLPTFVGEVSRAGKGSRRTFTESVGDYFSWIADKLGSRRQRARELSMLYGSAMIGAIALARAVDDPDLSAEILDNVRRRLHQLGRVSAR